MNSLATISDSGLLHSINVNNFIESETGSELDNEFASQLGTSPGDFSHAKNKDWWFNIQQQLEKETEKQLLSMDDSKDSATSTRKTKFRQVHQLFIKSTKHRYEHARLISNFTYYYSFSNSNQQTSIKAN